MNNQKPIRGIQLNRTHPLAKGLVGCWLFNEATGETVFDMSGNSNNGTLENGVAWGSDGLEFDGSDDYVNVPRNNLQGMENLTISVWVKRNSFVSFGGIVAENYNASHLKRHFFLSEFNSDGNVTFYIYGNSTFKNIYTSTGDVIENDVWTNIVAVFKSGDYLKLYKNGVEIKSTSTTITQIHTDTDLDLFIGKYSGNEFNGSIRSVNIYNQAKSAEEITWLYKEPYAMFEPAFNPALLYSAVPPVGAIMNQFQGVHVGADLYNGVFA